jgi:hypothetical protein
VRWSISAGAKKKAQVFLCFFWAREPRRKEITMQVISRHSQKLHDIMIARLEPHEEPLTNRQLAQISNAITGYSGGWVERRPGKHSKAIYVRIMNLQRRVLK